MKRAIGLIAATLLTTSVYSQDYSSSSSSSTQNPDSTPADYESRQSEAGAPATSDSSTSSSSGYEVSPGTSGGNSLTGQSNGANIQGDQGEDKTLTTRDSDVSGSEYKGSAESSSTSSDSSSSLETSGQLRGTGTADGAFHEPASPVREGSESEGWSGSGTFSGAGPGAVSGSASSSAEVSTELTPPVSESSSSFEAEVSGNAALENRDDDLSSRGLEPDSDALSREEAFSNSVEGDLDRDQVIIFEDWTIVEPDTSVGGPAGSDSGAASSSDADNRDASASGSIGVSSSDSDDSYSHELHQRVQRDWSSRIGNTDVPATPGVAPMTPRVMDHEFDHLRVYNSETSNSIGGAAGAESETKSSKDKENCDEDKKNKGSSAEFEEGELNSDSESSTSAPGEYGDRATSENYDDGHLNGNNAASSESLENSSPSEDGALTQPDL